MDEEVIFPEKGELVVATVKELRGYGAYLELDDYGIIGYLPISEVSSKWVRRLEDVIKPGQKIVVKVLRIDRESKSVDVSLKEVPEKERERVLRKWKRDQRGIQILNELAKELNIKYEELEEKLSPLIDRMPTVYDALEEIVINPGVLDRLSLSTYKTKIHKFLKKRVRPKIYVYELRLKMLYIGREGVFKLKKALEKIDKTISSISKEIKSIDIFNDGTPYYRVRIKSYRPAIIKKKVIPKLHEVIEDIKKEVNVEIDKEVTRVEI